MALDLYSKGTTNTLLAAKLDLAGGTMTGGLTLSASGIIFSDATYLTTAPAGSTLAADQLTAGVVTANPTAGPTASGDVLQYDGTGLVWAPGGGGGGAVWGGITGTVTDQTDLVTYVTGLGYQTASDVSTYVGANAYPLSSNPAGYLTSIPAKSFNAVSAMGGYYIQPSDFGNIVVDSSGGYNLILDFSTLSFPTGVEVLVFNANSSPISVSAYGGASVIGTAILGNCWGRIVVNNATNTVYYS